MIQGSEGVGPKTISSFGWGGVVPQHPCFHEEKRQKPPLLQCGDECRSQCIPAFIVALVLGVPAVMAGGPAATVGTIGIGLLVMIIVGILVTLISVIGTIRFARKNSMGQAFAFGAILQHIGKIGWGVISSRSSSSGLSRSSLASSLLRWR
jgi:hypothetical protein